MTTILKVLVWFLIYLLLCGSFALIKAYFIGRKVNKARHRSAKSAIQAHISLFISALAEKFGDRLFATDRLVYLALDNNCIAEIDLQIGTHQHSVSIKIGTATKLKPSEEKRITELGNKLETITKEIKDPLERLAELSKVLINYNKKYSEKPRHVAAELL